MMPEINEAGLIAIKHYNSNPAIAKVSDTVYMFTPRLNVSMAWVQPEHTDKLLAEMTKACCNQQKHKFLYANELDVSLWTTGERPQ